MIKTRILCDLCEKERGEANHWFVARRNNAGSIAFSPWGETIWTTEVIHLCGAECAHKLLSQFLEGK